MKSRQYLNCSTCVLIPTFFCQACTLCDLKCKQFQLVCIEVDFKNIQTLSDHQEYIQICLVNFRNGLLLAKALTKDALHGYERSNELMEVSLLID